MLSSLSLKRVAIALGLLGSVSAQAHYQLDLTTKNFSPDGFSRESIATNGKFSAPLIAVSKGERIMANVSSSITSTDIRQSTSIHWHGMFQHKSQTEDGTAFVNQCPIGPGSWYNYNFSTASQTGTYWYHSHLATQYCDGLRGPLVIYDPFDPLAHLYDVDDASTIITLGDWNHQPAELAFADPTILNPTPDSILINSLGRYVGGPASPLAVINVVKNKRYRFRLINISCFTYLTVSIDGHNMTVIEADGNEHQPLEVDSLTIFVAQRYSVVVTANRPIGNYWFRTVPGPAINNFANNTDPGVNNAIFRYAGAPSTEPTTNATTSVNPLVEANLVPLIDPAPPGGSNPPDMAINLVVGLSDPNWTVNGFSFFPPSVPVLLQILSGNTTAQDLLPQGSIYVLPTNSVIEISLPDTHGVENTHPFHLHGHSFSVVKSAGQTTPNYVNPPRRDVVAVNSGNVTFRFLTDNSGPWILHCHIDWHLNQGLAVVLAEDPAGVISGPNSAVVPPAWDDLCPKYNALPPSAQ